VPLRY
jgi:hypothetical protein